MHDELHRRVVVVQQQHAVEARPLGLRLGLGDDRGARRARAPAFGIVVVIVVVIVSQTGPSRHAGGCIHFGSFSGHGNFTGHGVAALGHPTVSRVGGT